MRKLLTSKTAGVACLIFGLVSIAWWAAQPRYQGKSMEWWFDQYLEDYTGSRYDHKLPLSPKQEVAIQAFRTFGESSIPFLIRDMHHLVEEFDESDLIYDILKKLLWNEHRNFRREWRRRGDAAYDLLEKLGIPYEWAQKYGAQVEIAPTQRNAFLIEMSLLHAATNHHDEIVRTLIPHLEKGDPKRYGALRILSKPTVKAHVAIPHLLNDGEDKSEFTYQTYAKLAPASSEIRTLLENRMDSENPREVFLAALATLNTESNHDLAIERIRSSFNKVLTMPNGNQNLLYTMLRTLIQWPYSIEPLTPTLLYLAHQSEASMEQITEILSISQPQFPKRETFDLKGAGNPDSQSRGKMCIYPNHAAMMG